MEKKTPSNCIHPLLKRTPPQHSTNQSCSRYITYLRSPTKYEHLYPGISDLVLIKFGLFHIEDNSDNPIKSFYVAAHEL